MENIDPIDIIEVEPEIEVPNWLKKNWPLILMLVAGFLIGLGIGAMLMKGSCEIVINDYEAILDTCLLWK